MNQWKSQLTCSYCSKIFKDPIDLPCGDSVCREHLSEKSVVKEKRIKCKDCNQEFEVTCDAFRSNKRIKKLVESQSYLSGEELSLKQELEVSIRKFFESYDNFVQLREKTDSDVYNHFQEIRFQIDEHRERIKERIDEIALAMIAETKEHEKMYLKSLKEKLFANLSFDESKSMEKQLKQLEETFRHPNLLIQTIQEMQQKQEESLGEIQFKINQMSKIKDILEVTNTFQPNLSLFNQEGETSLFGSIRLIEYSNMNSLNSQILHGERQSLELIILCEFSPDDKWKLLYRGTKDGFKQRDFHTKCDGHSNTLTILKAKGSQFIFGGFTSVSWESSAIDKWKSDPNAFIFSLTNKENTPLKMKVYLNYEDRAILCHSLCGPSFGCDIRIANNANTTMDSYSDLGFSYSHPQYEEGTNEAQSFLAGSKYFQLDEIEVYEKE
jgi:hypothetical protein